MNENHLKKGFDALRNKAIIYNKLWAYFDGNQPLKYSSSRLKDIFGNKLDARFTQNWCDVIVSSVTERMEFKQFTVAQNENATSSFKQWWESSEMNLDVDDVELCALVTGESFVFAWPNENGGIDAFYNDSRLVHIVYSSENPRIVHYAVKMWQADDKTMRLNLYYPDRIEYYATIKKADEVKDAKAFMPLLQNEDENSYIAPHNYGIPIFHFVRERRSIVSELKPSILDLQDSINKLMADMMVASEFQALPQRYIISEADTENLKNAPNEVWSLPAGDGLSQPTTAGQFPAANLDAFMSQIEKLSTAMSKISRTPQYYFFLGARSDPSGEALAAMDGPLIKKTEKYIKRFSSEWKRLGLFVAQILDIEGVTNDTLNVSYADPRTIQALTESTTLKTNVDAGVPLVTQLRRKGWTPQEIAQLNQDKQDEQAAQVGSLATGLLNQQRKFDQEGN